MKKSLPTLILAFILIAALIAGCGGTSAPDASGSPPASEAPPASDVPPASEAPPQDLPEKTEIVFGAARPLSGVYQVFEDSVFGPIYKMWVDEVNADGGIFVEEYGKKLPIRVITYDDTSDMATMVRMTEKLILEDKVDFMFPSCSTAFVFAQAEITNKYDKLLISAEGGSAELSAAFERYPMFFNSANHSITQVPELVSVLSEMGAESTFIMYVEDQHGVEYSGAAKPQLEAAGIEVLGMRSVPPDIQDLTPILNEAKNSGADAFLSFCYPDQNFPVVFTSMQIGYNPKAMLLGPGGNMDVLLAVVGEEAANGIMAFGGFNAKSSDGAAAFIDKFNAANPGLGLDWWGHLPYYAALQVLQQAIEGAGTLDNAAVAEYIKNNTFDTDMGDVYFHNNQIAGDCYLGQVGQWQGTVFEIIDTNERRTADPVYPKPEWPAG